MDREDGVELFNDYRVDLAAFQALSRCAADQPVGYLMDARDILQLPEMVLVDCGQHFRCGTGQSNRTLEITTLPMLDGGVDLAASMRSENRSRCDEGCRLSIPLREMRARIESRRYSLFRSLERRGQYS